MRVTGTLLLYRGFTVIVALLWHYGVGDAARLAAFSNTSYNLFEKHIKHGCVSLYIDDARDKLYAIDEMRVDFSAHGMTLERRRQRAPLKKSTAEQYWLWEKVVFESVIQHATQQKVDNRRSNSRLAKHTAIFETVQSMNTSPNNANLDLTLSLVCPGTPLISDFYAGDKSERLALTQSRAIDEQTRKHIELAMFEDQLLEFVLPEVDIPIQGDEAKSN